MFELSVTYSLKFFTTSTDIHILEGNYLQNLDLTIFQMLNFHHGQIFFQIRYC